MVDYIVNQDITFNLFEYLNDRDKLMLLSVNKCIYSFGNHITFKKYYKLTKISNSLFFDNFEAVTVQDFDSQSWNWYEKLPKRILKVHFEFKFFDRSYIIENLPENLQTLRVEYCWPFDNKTQVHVPPKIKYLSIDTNIEIIGSIPNTVTKLKLNNITWSNSIYTLPDSVKELTLRDLNGYVISNSVKKLTLDEIDSNTKNFIPKSVVDLTLDMWIQLGKTFDCNFIPDHIVYLHFGNYFHNKFIGKIPNSVEMLFFDNRYAGSLSDHLNDNIRYIHFGFCPKYSINELKQITIDGFNKEILDSSGSYAVTFRKILSNIDTDDSNNDNNDNKLLTII